MDTQLIKDEFCISMLMNDSENPENDQPIMSDDKYAEELQLQEMIISSFISLQRKSGDDSASGKVSMEIGESSKMGAKEAGESSHKLCEICDEMKDIDNMFPLRSCSHSFCTECISKHISIRIKQRAVGDEAKAVVITCPGVDCTSILEIGTCRGIVPGDVISMWGDALCKSMVSPSEKVYCPYKNCSGLMVKNSDDREVIREAECLFCRRLFCVKCNVPWHSGMDCDEFSRLNENERGREDVMVHDLAKKNRWQRCPHCKFFVERNKGCLHLTCRCGFEFCYACGKAWSSTHGRCQ